MVSKEEQAVFERGITAVARCSPMFWRLVTSRWVALLGLCLGILGIPGILQDLATWSGWFDQMPRTVSSASLSVGSLLVMAYLFAIRGRILGYVPKAARRRSGFPRRFSKRVRPRDPQSGLVRPRVGTTDSRNGPRGRPRHQPMGSHRSHHPQKRARWRRGLPRPCRYGPGPGNPRSAVPLHVHVRAFGELAHGTAHRAPP